MKTTFPVLLSSIILLTAAFGAEQEGPKAALPKIMEVTSVKVVPGKSAVVHAEGQVNSGGWTDVQLVESPGKKNPAGELHLDFVGRKPAGMATMALAPVKATFDVKAGVTKVTVHAAGNSQTAEVK